MLGPAATWNSDELAQHVLVNNQELLIFNARTLPCGGAKAFHFVDTSFWLRRGDYGHSQSKRTGLPGVSRGDTDPLEIIGRAGRFFSGPHVCELHLEKGDLVVLSEGAVNEYETLAVCRTASAYSFPAVTTLQVLAPYGITKAPKLLRQTIEFSFFFGISGNSPACRLLFFHPQALQLMRIFLPPIMAPDYTIEPGVLARRIRNLPYLDLMSKRSLGPAAIPDLPLKWLVNLAAKSCLFWVS
jgi:hypothetical protein